MQIAVGNLYGTTSGEVVYAGDAPTTPTLSCNIDLRLANLGSHRDSKRRSP
jgi:hypothetical protein